jgi:hypothetical protein
MKKSILISVLSLLRFATTRTFDFIISLIIYMAIPLILQSVPLSLIFLIFHFVFFITFYPKIREHACSDQSYDEYTKAITRLKNGEKIKDVLK